MDILAFSIAGLWGGVWPILLFVLGIAAVIFVHELGHFMVAKLVGIKVERFALGFGPRLFGVKIGETDYSVMLLPLGGYVKMLGQEDFAPLKDGQDDPRAFNNKPVGARFTVISAGVIMNVVFAGLLFVLVVVVGIRFPAPVVGSVRPGFPASQAKIAWHDSAGAGTAPATRPAESIGLKPGDRITHIDGEGLLLKTIGKEITRFRRLQIIPALSDKDDQYALTVEREVDGRVLVGTALMSPKLGGEGVYGNLLVFGIGMPLSTELGRLKNVPPWDPFEEGDRIIAIDGREVAHHWDIARIEGKLLGRRVTVTVLRKRKRVDLPVQPTLRGPGGTYFLRDGSVVRGKCVDYDSAEDVYTVRSPDGSEQVLAGKNILSEDLDVLGMAPRLRVAQVVKGSPAEEAGVEPGDVIVRYGDHAPVSHQKLLDLSSRFVESGTKIVLLRNGQRLPPREIRPTSRKGRALIGIHHDVDIDHLVVATVRPGSPAAKAGLLPGDLIEKVNDIAVDTWPELLAALRDQAPAGKEVELTVRRGPREFGPERERHGLVLSLGKLDTGVFDPEDYVSLVVRPPRPFKTLTEPIQRMGPLAALAWGARETVFFGASSYATLRGLIAGSLSPKAVAGPVGIGGMAIETARQGFAHFVYFMAMISVSLAVVNFLPVPVVDGGHAVFLVIEKIRGRPLSLKVMNAAQMVGLALILFVFVAVTWQDISRMVSGWW